MLERNPGSKARWIAFESFCRACGLKPACAQQLLQLAMHVEPFTQPVVRQKMVAAGLAQLILRQVLFPLVVEVPELQVAEKIGFFVGELGVALVGRLLLVERPIARVVHRQSRGDDQDLVQAILGIAGQDHPADARIDRQPRQRSAQIGQLLLVVDRAQLEQGFVAVANRFGPRRIEERKIVDVAEPQRLGLQNHGGQVAAQNLRRRETVAGLKILFAKEPDADARPDAATAPLALLGRGLRNGLDR